MVADSSSHDSATTENDGEGEILGEMQGKRRSVRNYAIQSTGSSIVYMLTLDCLGNKTTQSQQRTRNVVWLCVITKGDILPWSQPSWIRQWILVINLNGTNGSRRSRLTEIRTHVTQSP